MEDFFYFGLFGAAEGVVFGEFGLPLFLDWVVASGVGVGGGTAPLGRLSDIC